MKDLLLVLLRVHLVFIWHQVALPVLSELVYEAAVPWKKSTSDKEPGISQMIPGHCLICLVCDRTGLGNLLFICFLPHLKMVPMLSPQSAPNSCMWEEVPATQLLLPAIRFTHVWDGEKKWGSHRHPNSALVKGRSSAKAKSSAANGFQPTRLPGKSAVSRCSLPNIITVQADFL